MLLYPTSIYKRRIYVFNEIARADNNYVRSLSQPIETLEKLVCRLVNMLVGELAVGIRQGGLRHGANALTRTTSPHSFPRDAFSLELAKVSTSSMKTTVSAVSSIELDRIVSKSLPTSLLLSPNHLLRSVCELTSTNLVV